MKNTNCDNCGKQISKVTIHKTNFCSRKCFAAFRTGHNWNNIVPWNKGKTNVYSKETKNKMRAKKLGNKASEETRRKMGKAHKGNKTNFWQGGINKLSGDIRKSIENRLWKESILRRDDYTCMECGERGGRLQIHHIVSFSILLKDFLAVYSQFSPIDDKEILQRLAISYSQFWDINNGETLCVKCHKETDSYLKAG